MVRCTLRSMTNVGAARASADARAAIGCFVRAHEIAAEDSGSHFPVQRPPLDKGGLQGGFWEL